MQGRCKPSAIELALIAEAQPVFAVFDRKVTNNCGVFQIYRLHSCLLLLAGTTSAILRASLVELPIEVDEEGAAPANIWDIQPKFVTNGVINGRFWDKWNNKWHEKRSRLGLLNLCYL